MGFSFNISTVMRKVLVALSVLALASCSEKKEQVRTLDNVAYTIETTVLKDGTTLSVVHNPEITKR